MGIGDDFCLDSVVNDQIPTWHMNFPHLAIFQSKLAILGYGRHQSIGWFDVTDEACEEKYR